MEVKDSLLDIVNSLFGRGVLWDSITDYQNKTPYRIDRVLKVCVLNLQR